MRIRDRLCGFLGLTTSGTITGTGSTMIGSMKIGSGIGSGIGSTRTASVMSGSGNISGAGGGMPALGLMLLEFARLESLMVPARKSVL